MVQSVAVLQVENSDRQFKSVDLALEWSKQVMALATGSLVLSVTFVKDLFNGRIEWASMLIITWILLVLCILSGFVFLGALCSMIDNSDRKISIYESPVQWMALIHFGFFVTALVVFAIFAILNLNRLN